MKSLFECEIAKYSFMFFSTILYGMYSTAIPINKMYKEMLYMHAS